MIQLYTHQIEQAYSLYQNELDERLEYYDFRNMIYFLKGLFPWTFDEHLYASDDGMKTQHGYIFHTDSKTLRSAINAYIYDDPSYLDTKTQNDLQIASAPF